jgi:hypothetical protein
VSRHYSASPAAAAVRSIDKVYALRSRAGDRPERIAAGHDLAPLSCDE